MSKTKIIISVIFLIFAIVGVVAGVFLVQRQQDIRRDAAVPGGQATIEITPGTGSFDAGEQFDVKVRFNTNGEVISGVSVRLIHNSPELQLQNSQLNSALLATGSWSCPVQPSSQQQGNSVFIDLACINTSTGGFTSSGTTDLVTLTFRADSVPSTNPVTMSFDNALTVITLKSTGEDTLLIPQSTGSYTIIGTQQEETTTPTATPTTPPNNPTTTPTTPPGTDGVNPTATPTFTPTPTSGTGGVNTTATPTPTSATKGGTTSPTLPPDVPDSGISTPLIMGAGVGSVLLLLGLLLVL